MNNLGLVFGLPAGVIDGKFHPTTMVVKQMPKSFEKKAIKLEIRHRYFVLYLYVACRLDIRLSFTTVSPNSDSEDFYSPQTNFNVKDLRSVLRTGGPVIKDLIVVVREGMICYKDRNFATSFRDFVTGIYQAVVLGNKKTGTLPDPPLNVDDQFFRIHVCVDIYSITLVLELTIVANLYRTWTTQRSK
jgi:hypothetical protein